MSRMKSRKIEINANAKINLFLEVGLRRADGYHDIESVMQAVTLCDKVTVEVSVYDLTKGRITWRTKAERNGN